MSLPGSLAARAVALLPVLSDNYVMVLHDDHQAVVVDPAVAAPVAAWLDAQQLELVAVLQLLQKCVVRNALELRKRRRRRERERVVVVTH